MKEATEEEMEKGIRSLRRILAQGRQSKMDTEKVKSEPREETLSEKVDIHKGRLDRQGKDISVLWKGVNKLAEQNNKMVIIIRELIQQSSVEALKGIKDKGISSF